MARWLAGIAALLFIATGSFLAFAGSAEEPKTPPAPEPRQPASSGQLPLSPIPEAPEADPKSKEERRFARADKNEDGKISFDEIVEPRRKAFARLDTNQDGKLAFEEWAVRTIDKFEGADADRSKWLTPAEYATTAPKARKKPACRC